MFILGLVSSDSRLGDWKICSTPRQLAVRAPVGWKGSQLRGETLSPVSGCLLIEESEGITRSNGGMREEMTEF